MSHSRLRILRCSVSHYSITGGEESVGIQDFSVLPFGPIEDPVRHLRLSTTWPQLSEHLVTETESYSDLDPLQVGDDYLYLE